MFSPDGKGIMFPWDETTGKVTSHQRSSQLQLPVERVIQLITAG